MLRISGQLIVNITLDDQHVVEQLDDLIDLSIIEQSGTDLPIIEIIFKTGRSSTLTRLNEGAWLNVTVSDNDSKLLDSTFIPQHPSISRSGANKWAIRLTGIDSSIIGWSRSNVTISPQCSGVERIREIAGSCGMTVEGISKSLDKQNWIQNGQTSKQHVDDVWPHIDLDQSFPLLACTLEGIRIKDAEVLIRSEPSWEFTNGQSGQKTINYDPDYDFEIMGGFFNSVGGRGLHSNILNVENGQYSNSQGTPNSMMALTTELNMGRDFKPIGLPNKNQTRNVHENYWKSWTHNLTNLALYSTNRITVTWPAKYRPIHPLDLVMFREQDIQDRDQSVEMFSGLYIVTKVSRRVANGQFKTLVQMVRESSNHNQGKKL